MKSDLDRLMQEAELDALLVIGSSLHNAAMAYFTGRIHLTHGYLIKKRGQAPLLFHSSIEREEAARSGLQTKNLDDYNIAELLEQTQGDTVAASVLRFQRIFADYGIEGRVALYGKIHAGDGFSTLRKLETALDGVALVGEPAGKSVLSAARVTKDAEEVEQIRSMGKVTAAVIGDVADFLTSHQAKDGVLVNRAGEVLTIGEVKRRIDLWLAMRDAWNPERTIFAIGREAGIPHSTGLNDRPVEVGRAIIFDLFPSQVGGGYFYDLTRTWALGFASDALQELHTQVLEVYQGVFSQLELNAPCREYQVMACERFEALGHPTTLNSPRTQDGYVHSLAHGVGLDIHEAPSFSHLESNTDRLQPGTVFTFEPGLYYPDRELGVRIEDTVWARPDGTFEVLAEVPKDLVLKVPGV